MNELREMKISYTNNAIGPRVNNCDVANYLNSIYGNLDIDFHEYFVAIFLNRTNNILGHKIIAKGHDHGVMVCNKMVASLAITSGSHGVIVAHNHPSGSLKPSIADIKVTKRLQEALELFDIKLLDHIILAGNGLYESIIDN